MKKILALFILLIMTCFPAFSKEKVQMDDSTVGVYVFKIDKNANLHMFCIFLFNIF